MTMKPVKLYPHNLKKGDVVRATVARPVMVNGGGQRDFADLLEGDLAVVVVAVHDGWSRFGWFDLFLLRLGALAPRFGDYEMVRHWEMADAQAG